MNGFQNIWPLLALRFNDLENVGGNPSGGAAARPGEFRCFGGEIDLRARRGKRGPGTVAGYAAVYDKWTDLGWFEERIAPGAFSESLASSDSDVRALFGHDSGRVLGRTKSGTLKLADDAVGLRAKIDLPDTSDGRDLAVSVGRGDIDGMSFGFFVVEDNWEYAKTAGEKDRRTLLKIDIYEVSAVAFPAYLETSLALASLREFLGDRDRRGNGGEDPAAGSRFPLEDYLGRLGRLGVRIQPQPQDYEN